MKAEVIQRSLKKRARLTPGQVRRAHIIVNPASGQDEPVLAPANRVFNKFGVSWTIDVTRRDKDAAESAAQAIERGVDVLCVYGGDGTISQVAPVVAGGKVPVAILPGGTGNVLARALDIPLALEDALTLACQRPAILNLDALAVDDGLSLLRVSAGIEATMMAATDRQKKDQLGWLAYVLSGVEAVLSSERETVEITVDDELWVFEGVAVVIANVGQLSRLNASLPGTIDPGDGQADILLVRDVGAQAFWSEPPRLRAPADMVDPRFARAPIWHLRAKNVTLHTPDWPVQRDGDPIGRAPVSVSVAPDTVPLVVPAPE